MINMPVETKHALEAVLATLLDEFAQSAGERDKLGGTAKRERNLI